MISKLNPPSRCSVFIAWMRQCGQEAHWLVNGEVMCDEHIEDMAEDAGFNDEDEAHLEPARGDIAQRSVDGLV